MSWHGGRSLARRDRRGFALVTVLWLVVGASTLSTATLILLRSSIAAARNRAHLTTASWRAEACVERVRAAIGDVLNTAVSNANAWRTLDRIIESSPYVTSLPCTVTLRPAGATLDINEADREDLLQLFGYLGVGERARDSVVDAILDWKDGDDAPRAHGAERDWYIANKRLAPRNGLIGSVSEVRFIRGLEQAGGLDSLFGVERGRILLDRAPLAVIAALPGMTEESVARIAERRARGQEIGEAASLAAQLTSSARQALESRFAELAQRVTAEPDAWIVRASATAGSPPVASELEVKLVRAGYRAAVMRRRSWP